MKDGVEGVSTLIEPSRHSLVENTTGLAAREFHSATLAYANTLLSERSDAVA